MATHYSIHVASLNGERFSDQVDSNVRDHIKQLALDPLFNLGDKVATKRGKSDEFNAKVVYYYHNGRITVTTHYKQYTANQRQGRRRF
jgi:hypothetical protein